MSDTDARTQARRAAQPILRVLHVLLGIACLVPGSSVAGMILPVRAGFVAFRRGAADMIAGGLTMEISGGLLPMSGVGAALGPGASGKLIEAHSGAVFAWTAAIHLARGLTPLDRIRRGPPVPEVEKAGLVALLRMSEAVLPPDPRAAGPAPDGEETAG